jgi:hypothetical protein
MRDSRIKGEAMGRAAELYTYPTDAQTTAAQAARQGCLCRFRGPVEECNQSEHRGARAFVSLGGYADLRRTYARARIPFGLCSILLGGEQGARPWIVCPHRLFYAGRHSTTVEQYIYRQWGLAQNDKVGLWKEINISVGERGKDFKYTFDYVFRKVITEGPTRFGSTPFLVEVMTVSTSGGGVEECFVSALRGRPSETRTSVNHRQVLARMMSQFVAKAQVAHDWGGKAVWIVQDLFWDYVCRTTGFSMDMFYDDPSGNVVMLVKRLETGGYDKRRSGHEEYRLALDRILRGWDRFERSQQQSNVGRDFASVLNAPFTPDKSVIIDATDRRSPVAVLTCV